MKILALQHSIDVRHRKLSVGLEYVQPPINGLDIFNISESDTSGKMVASAIALVGVLFSSIVTALGISLKHSIDLQAEERLKQEAAIKAVEILDRSGEELPMMQKSGGRSRCWGSSQSLATGDRKFERPA